MANEENNIDNFFEIRVDKHGHEELGHFCLMEESKQNQGETGIVAHLLTSEGRFLGNLLPTIKCQFDFTLQLVPLTVIGWLAFYSQCGGEGHLNITGILVTSQEEDLKVSCHSHTRKMTIFFPVFVSFCCLTMLAIWNLWCRVEIFPKTDIIISIPIECNIYLSVQSPWVL